MAILVINGGSKTEKVDVEFADIGIKGSGTVRNIWEHKDEGEVSSKLNTINLDSHDSAFVLVTPHKAILSE